MDGSPQKLLLAQLTSAKKVLSSVNESPDTSFEYVPPKVNLIALGFLIIFSMLLLCVVYVVGVGGSSG